MTIELRDFFAGMALAGLLANQHANRDEKCLLTIVNTAYGIADGLLTQRGNDAPNPDTSADAINDDAGIGLAVGSDNAGRNANLASGDETGSRATAGSGNSFLHPLGSWSAIDRSGEIESKHDEPAGVSDAKQPAADTVDADNKTEFDEIVDNYAAFKARTWGDKRVEANTERNQEVCRRPATVYEGES